MPVSDQVINDPGIFTMPGGVGFADDEQKKKIKLTLYDGSVVKHWYWGNIGFELSSMRMAKGRNPILFNHDTNLRVAFSDDAEFQPKFTMAGRFLKTSAIAEEVRTQMDEGFPFEASMRVDQDRSRIEYIKEGDAGEVNGHKLKGPGTIFRDAIIMEGSVCVFGSLKNTQSKSFAANPIFKENIMAKETATKMTVEQLTVEKFAEARPDLLSAIVKEAEAGGAESERKRFTELKAACGEDAGLLVECFEQGKATAEASAMRVEKLAAQNKSQREEIEKLKAGKVDPAASEFKNAPDPEQAAAGEFDEKNATDEQLKEHFAKTQDLQDKFSGPDAYVAYVRHSD